MGLTEGIERPAFPFLVARGRSGTTLLRAMFDAHPSMAIPGESHFVVQFATRRERYEASASFDVDGFTRDLFDHWAFRRWGLAESDVLDVLADRRPTDLASAFRCTYEAYAASFGKERFGDKTPSYVQHIDLLAETFPESVFIHLIRDGRDVSLSYVDTDFGVSTFGQAAIYWDRFVRAGRAAGARLGAGRYREVRYEDLVRDPAPILTELCGFVGLDFDERMLRYYEQADRLAPTISHGEHHRNVRRPPTVGMRDWRRELSAGDRAAFEAIAGDLLDELGYERAGVPHGLGTKLVVTRFRLEAEARRIAHGTRVRTRKLRKRIARRLRSRRPRPAPEGQPLGGQP
jgi:hypothetical protein